jgi:hypothetical protein
MCPTTKKDPNRSATDLPSMSVRIDLQNKEFDAVDKLCARWRILQKVAVVDDDYPEMRHYYESAMKDLIDAIRANGRI